MKYYIFILISIVLVSCIDQYADKPEKLIEEDKMAQIFMDIYLLEKKIDKADFKKDTAFHVYLELEKDIWEKHQVSKEDFQTNHNYYLNHLEDLEGIYKNVIDSLGVRESKMKN